MMGLEGRIISNNVGKEGASGRVRGRGSGLKLGGYTFGRIVHCEYIFGKVVLKVPGVKKSV